jgi:predicted molibdopterin-dependent oxidoreductase YjgC
MQGLRIDGKVARTAAATIFVDREPLAAFAGESLAAALAAAGRLMLRRSPRSGAPRGGFCHMGTCQECRVIVDGEPVLACLTPVRDGMVVTLGLRR